MLHQGPFPKQIFFLKSRWSRYRKAVRLPLAKIFLIENPASFQDTGKLYTNTVY